MRTIKIVSDSSSNVLTMSDVDYAVAPMKVITDKMEFVDTPRLDVEQMVQWFSTYKGASRTSCPNTEDWLTAFGDGDDIFCVTITSGLSGSYNAACAAKEIYETEHCGKRVCVIDSLSAGPELVLIIEKLKKLIAEGNGYEDVCQKIEVYKKSTGLVFMLESLQNFAANGRVSPAVARVAGVLGIRVVGKASAVGTLEPIHKSRGEKRALREMMQHMIENGLCRGKVRIAHCQNETAAQSLKQTLLSQLPAVDVEICVCRGLCSYYAEKGGMLVAFEKF